MSWVLLSFVSAMLLGCYDGAKKVSVRDNAVPMVLLVSVSIGATIYVPLILWSSFSAGSVPAERFVVLPLSTDDHLLIFAKAVLVGASWTFAFTALKHLPLSIAAPIRSTSPLWTILIAVVFLGERPSVLQALGMVVTLIGFWQFTLVGRREGVRFTRNRSVGWMVIATLLGACSSIYDKWLLQSHGLSAVTLQAWFTVYLVPVMVPLALNWRFGQVRQQRRAGLNTDAASEEQPSQGNAPTRFQWRRSLLAVSPLLIVADWFYFTALEDPDAMVSVISVIRRSSVVIALAFAAGALSEQNFRAKLFCVAQVLLGVLLISY
ncbi:MAG: EamA family transporter [Planctomycetota bacterium]